MAEAKLVWSRLTPDILRATVDFNPCHLVNHKGHPGERRRGLGGQPLVDVVLVHPIANLTCLWAHTGMQPSAPEYLGFLPVEEAIGEVLIQVKCAAPLAQAIDFHLQVFGL